MRARTRRLTDPGPLSAAWPNATWITPSIALP
ncbi:cytochrome PufQ [Allochromatium vinosum]